MTNYAIADNLNLLAQLLDIHGENSYKAKSYSIAAFAIEKLDVELAEMPQKQIFSLKNIGEGAGKKILELLETGQLQELASIIAKTPPGVLEMLRIKGLGPKKISFIWKDLNIESLGELLQACSENRLSKCKGFGDKTQLKIKEGIEFYLRSQGKFLFSQIEEYAHHFNQLLKNEFPGYSFIPVGNLPRQLEVIEELEWVTDANPAALLTYLEQLEHEVVDRSTARSTLRSPDNVTIVFFHAAKDQLVSEAFRLNCSEDFLNAFTKNYGEPNSYPTDEAIFVQNKLSYIPVYLRENPSILEKAKADSLPLVITPADIKGLIHCHSMWSDGAESIEHMARACMDRGLEYMVISDHSKTASYAGGLTEDRILAQHQQIDELNTKLAPFKIFKSIESDILSDGSLDYDAAVLNNFDIIITSVHSQLSMTAEKAMPRLLNCIRNPFTSILGHMTGRLLLSRNGLQVDHRELIDACAKHNVVIELNANPRRLDMDWRWIEYAIGKGVLISIDPDAHSIPEIDYTRYGILVAQKAGLMAKNNLSSYRLAEFEHFVTLQQRKRKLS